jgi:hypothetical protein
MIYDDLSRMILLGVDVYTPPENDEMLNDIICLGYSYEDVHTKLRSYMI